MFLPHETAQALVIAKPVPVLSFGKIVLIGATIAGIAWMLKREERKAAAQAITEELRGI